jgi:hypothetical protein
MITSPSRESKKIKIKISPRILSRDPLPSSPVENNTENNCPKNDYYQNPDGNWGRSTAESQTHIRGSTNYPIPNIVTLSNPGPSTHFSGV